MAKKSSRKASVKKTSRKVSANKSPRNELFFASFNDFKDEIPTLRRNKQLHPQTLVNLTYILNKDFLGDHISSETNVNGGRTDAFFYKMNEGKIIHIEIFASIGQVTQDLRLLEQSQADFLIAIIIDPEVDAGVANKFHREKPYPEPIQLFNLSDFYLQPKIPDTINRMHKIIDAVQTENKIRRNDTPKTLDFDTIHGILQTSAPDAWNWLDGRKKQYVYKQDVLLRIELFTSQEDHKHYEEVQKKVRQQGISGDIAARDVIKREYSALCSWAADFHDPWFYLKTAEVYYGSSLIEEYPVLSCDGYRIDIVAPRPAPDSTGEDPLKLQISRLEYNISCILTCCGSNAKIWDYEARFPRDKILISD